MKIVKLNITKQTPHYMYRAFKMGFAITFLFFLLLLMLMITPSFVTGEIDIHNDGKDLIMFGVVVLGLGLNGGLSLVILVYLILPKIAYINSGHKAVTYDANDIQKST